MKRVVIISDTHCGHRYGLTPPVWQQRMPELEPVQASLWEWFTSTVAKLGRVDVLVCNGDMIDGKGEKSEGVELITANRQEQVVMATEVVQEFKAKKIRVIAGTCYHSGRGEEFERGLATAVGGTFGGEDFFRVGGVTLHCRHHISTAQLPYTKATPLLRTMMQDILSTLVGAGGERADVVIRSHAHSFMSVCCDLGVGFVTDGMQIRSRLGRRLDGWSDVGLLELLIDGKEVEWQRHRFCPPEMARKALPCL